MANEMKQPKLAPKGNETAKNFSGGKLGAGSPAMPEGVPVGINKKPLETNKGVEKRLNKMFKKTGQPTLGVWNTKDRKNPTAQPAQVKLNPALNYKPTAEQLEKGKARTLADKGTIDESEKIRLMMGIPENNWNEAKNDSNEVPNPDFAARKQKLWDKYDQLTDEQKKDFALNVYHYGTEGHDNPLGKFRDPHTGEIMYADSGNNFEDRGDYLLGKDNDSQAQLIDSVDNLYKQGLTDEDLEKLFNEYPTQDLDPWDDKDEREQASKLWGTDLETKRTKAMNSLTDEQRRLVENDSRASMLKDYIDYGKTHLSGKDLEEYNKLLQEASHYGKLADNEQIPIFYDDGNLTYEADNWEKWHENGQKFVDTMKKIDNFLDNKNIDFKD